MLTVDEAHEGQRIDNFLLARLKGVPRSHIYRLLRTGQVRVNKGRIKPVYRLKQGDVVRVPPVNVAASRENVVPDALCERLEDRILYEDQEIMILNKPPGVAVHGGQNLPWGVIEAVRRLRGDGTDLVHRLDRGTSGCLILTLDRRFLKQMNALFADRQMYKRYRTLLQGRWRGGEKSLDLSLAKGREASGRRRIYIDDEGKTSLSRFIPVACFDRASLLDVEIGTGRMHQIRIHAAHLGHPVAGDDKYGDFAFNREMRHFGLKRMFLHAAELRFELPWSGRQIQVEAPLDDDLQQVVARLETENG